MLGVIGGRRGGERLSLLLEKTGLPAMLEAVEIAESVAMEDVESTLGRELAPDPLGGLDEGAELVLLVLDRELILHYGSREAALRAYGEPLQRHVPCSLPNSGFELFDGLASRTGLGGDEAEDDGFVLGNVPEGLEVARALVVVLEEQAVGVFSSLQ